MVATLIDYDDRIYYNEGYDVRKSVNINRPIILHGYNSGLSYYKLNNKYYLFNHYYRNEGTWSIFTSLIINLNKVKNIYIIYNLLNQLTIRKYLFQKL